MSVISSRFLNEKFAQPAEATSYISRVSPINGSEFTPSSSIIFRIPGQLANTYLDPLNSFLRFTYESDASAAVYTAHLPGAGAPCLFESINLNQSGSNLSTYGNYATFRSMKVKKTADADYYRGVGSVLAGTRPDKASLANNFDVEQFGTNGEKIHGASVSRTFVDSLCHHTTMFNSGKMIPLMSREHLDLRYQLGNFSYAAKWTASGNNTTASLNDSNTFKLKNCELVLTYVQVADSVQKKILDYHKNLMCLECIGVGYSAHSISSSSSQTIPLGLAYSSLMGIEAVQTPNSTTPEDLHNTTFVDNHLKDYQLIVDGTPIQALRPVKSEDMAEKLAMDLISKHELHKFSGLPILNGSDATASIPATAHDGEGFNGISLDLCVFKGKSANWAHPTENRICQGVSTIASSNALVLNFSYTPTPVTLGVYASYRQVLILNPSTLLWQVSQ